MSEERGNRKIREGIVVSTKMKNTAVVKVSSNYAHPLYGKIITKTKKYYAHVEEEGSLKEGDKVSIVECRPMSKLKRWRVVSETK